MSGGIGSLGEIVSGTLLAGAVEPDTGSTHSNGGGVCLNCKGALIGPHCHQCGQSAHIHRTLVAFWHDFAHSILHFEGKIWRTLPLLAFHPGQLTRRYVHGERARFISPIALFLFSVFLMFSVFSFVGGSSQTDATQQAKRTAAATELKKSAADLQKAAADLQTARAGAPNGPLNTKDQALQSFVAGVKSGSSTDQTEFNDVIKRAQIHVNVGVPEWNKILTDQAMKARENPELLFLKVEQGAHKYSWIIIPLSAPFLWLTFCWRRDVKMYDHIVFITYSVCFMMLLFVMMVLLKPLHVPRMIRVPFALFGFFAAPPLHIYKQLKGAYLLSRWGALWRTGAMLMTALIVMPIFISIILLMGLVG
jgi:hypothetical protein